MEGRSVGLIEPVVRGLSVRLRFLAPCRDASGAVLGLFELDARPFPFGIAMPVRVLTVKVVFVMGFVHSMDLSSGFAFSAFDIVSEPGMASSSASVAGLDGVWRGCGDTSG